MRRAFSRERWLRCELCGLAATRRTVVLGRGEVPADLLLVGEAPGRSEDMVGEPFVGPSGRLLRKALDLALSLEGIPEGGAPTVYITNVVACRPCDSRAGENRKPTAEEAWKCLRRLEDEALAVRPREVVLLGKTAALYARKLFPRAAEAQHPAYLLRRGGEGCPEYRAFVRTLADALRRAAEHRKEEKR